MRRARALGVAAGVVALSLLALAARRAFPATPPSGVAAESPTSDLEIAGCPEDLRVLSATRFRVSFEELDCIDLDQIIVGYSGPACAEAMARAGGNARACVERFKTLSPRSRRTVDMVLPRSGAPHVEACVLDIVVTETGDFTLNGSPFQLPDFEQRARALCDLDEARAIIDASREVPYARVISLMDALRTAGIGKISFKAER